MKSKHLTAAQQKAAEKKYKAEGKKIFLAGNEAAVKKAEKAEQEKAAKKHKWKATAEHVKKMQEKEKHLAGGLEVKFKAEKKKREATHKHKRKALWAIREKDMKSKNLTAAQQKAAEKKYKAEGKKIFLAGNEAAVKKADKAQKALQAKKHKWKATAEHVKKMQEKE